MNKSHSYFHIYELTVQTAGAEFVGREISSEI